MGDDRGEDCLGGAFDALDRMKRAAQRGTGCHLTAEMIQGLAVTSVGQMWLAPSEEPDNG